MLTAWPEGGDCVGKCVCLHLGPAASNFYFYSQSPAENMTTDFLGFS